MYPVNPMYLSWVSSSYESYASYAYLWRQLPPRMYPTNLMNHMNRTNPSASSACSPPALASSWRVRVRVRVESYGCTLTLRPMYPANPSGGSACSPPALQVLEALPPSLNPMHSMNDMSRMNRMNPSGRSYLPV